jgi:hypothetical protein
MSACLDAHCAFVGRAITAGRAAVSVPDSKSRNIPEVVLVRRWAVGVLGIGGKGGVG